MILKCKMCGGDLPATEGAMTCECEYCGSVNTLPAYDHREERANLYNRANRLRMQCEFDKALAAYEKILDRDNADAEAHWGAVLSRWGIEYVKDPTTGERKPTCHRVQMQSILADADYLAALEHAADAAAKDAYAAEGRRIAEIQKDILAISQQETPYDVFICYKETDENGQRTKDSTLAQEIYYQLTDGGYKVFFSRITLEEKLGRQYEPYIFAALNSARVMLVVGTNPAYFEAVWVKNEWSRYLRLMQGDRNRLLIPCYRDMDPYDLPEELSNLQSQDMSRIGFMQDLLRGIKKVLDAKKEQPQPVAAAQPVVVAAPAVGSIEPLYKRAMLFLEDGDFSGAVEYANRILDMDPEYAPAYMVKVLAHYRCRTEAQLQDTCADIDIEKNLDLQKAIRFAQDPAQYEQISNRVVQSGVFVRMMKGIGVGCNIKSGVEKMTQDAQTVLQQRIDSKRTRDANEAAYREAEKTLAQLGGYPHAEAFAALFAQLAQIMHRVEQTNVFVQTMVTLKVRCLLRDGVEQMTAGVMAELQKRIDEQGTNDADETDYKRAAERLAQLKDYPFAAECAALCTRLTKIMPVYAQYRWLKSEENRRVSADWRKAKELARAYAELGEYRDAQTCSERMMRTAEEVIKSEYDRVVDEIKNAQTVADAQNALARIQHLSRQIDISEAKELCSKRVLEIQQKEKAEEEAAARAKARAARNKTIVTVLILLAIVAVCAYILLIKPMMHYKNAEALLAEGKYVEASEAFIKAGSYSDAAERVGEPYYVEAEALLAQGNEAGAIEAFTKAGSYSDAKVRIEKIYYQQAESLLSDGKYAEASAAFEKAGDYSDAGARIKEPYYVEAEELLVQGKYAEASAAFMKAGHYYDAERRIHALDRILEPYYVEAEALLAQGKYAEASAAFEKAGDYSDAKTRISEAHYLEAEALLAQGKYAEASAAFEKAGDYSDAKTRISEAHYLEAKSLLTQGRHDEAYQQFLLVKGYKDVDALLATDQSLMAAARMASFKQVGRYVTYGTYEQDNNLKNGKEPIEWMVLEYDEEAQAALLLSRYGLDVRAYHHTTPYPTWEKSDIRAWLNGEFLNAAFTTEELAAITITKISTPNYGIFYGGADTRDRVFLLSLREVPEYFADYTARRATPTKYAEAQGVNPSTSYSIDGVGCCWWWLRSPGDNSSSAARVGRDGAFYTDYVNNDVNVVRPAIKIDLNAL